MNSNTNAINWFEIPASELSRAKKFYETIFDIEMHETEMADIVMASFPYEPGSGKAAGAVVKGPNHAPATVGVVLYLNGDPDLSHALDKVEAAGGKITMPKTQISPEIGFMAFFMDTEGNHIGLHSSH